MEKISDEFADWIAIAAFYKAVHLVEMLRAVDGQHSRGHAGRRKYLKTVYPKIWIEYFPLDNFSIHARYYCKRIDGTKVRTELLGKRLPALESLVEGEIRKRTRRR